MCIRGFPGGTSGKEPACQGRRPKRCGSFLGLQDLLGQGVAAHSSLLAWRVHGQGSLVGYCPWGQKSQTGLSNEATKIMYQHCNGCWEHSGGPQRDILSWGPDKVMGSDLTVT